MRRRSNPARRRLIPRNLMRSTIQPALIGGTGAVVNDIGYNLLLGAIPAAVAPGIVDQFRTGYLRHAGKLASALLLTYAAGFVVNRRTAETLGVGAITVVGYNVARDVVMQVAPQLPLGAYVGRRRLGAYPGAGWQAKGTLPPMGSNYRRSGLAAYVRPRAPQLSGARSAGSFGVPPQLETANWYAGRRSAPEGYHEGQAA